MGIKERAEQARASAATARTRRPGFQTHVRTGYEDPDFSTMERPAYMQERAAPAFRQGILEQTVLSLIAALPAEQAAALLDNAACRTCDEMGEFMDDPILIEAEYEKLSDITSALRKKDAD